MGLLADRQIRKLALEGMITPFVDHQVRDGNISYGLSSYGYDIRVDNKFKYMLPPLDGTSLFDLTYVVDPKNIDTSLFDEIEQDHCYILPNSYVLAQSVETFDMPENVTGVCVGKSTYVRCGIHILMSPLEACFSDDTEILTKDGWKLFKDVSLGEYVLGMSDKGVAEWQPVEKKQEYLYSGDMCLFDGRSINLLVTPDHKCLVRKSRNSHTRTKWFTETAENIYKHYSYEMSREVAWEGEDIEDTIEIGKHILNTNLFLRLLGVYIGDGSAYIQHGYVIKLAALKERKLREYDELLTALGFKHSDNKRGYTFNSKDLYEVFHPLGHAHEKYIPNWVKNLPPHRLEHLLWGLMHSDGNIQTGMYHTCSKRLSDDVQEVAFKAGYSAIIRTRPIREDSFIKGRPIHQHYPQYVIRVVGKHLTPKIRPDIQSKQYYQGTVYDVTVPGHVIFVRRNGKALWSGNCWKGVLTLEIANLTPYPAKIYANEGIAQILFFEGDAECVTSYADRNGKYQNQTGIVLPKV